MEGARFAGASVPAEGLLCAPCRMVPPEFERAVAYGVYEDELREMVHLLKYERMSAVARPLGRMLAAAMEMLEGAAATELVVVAVPLFPAKERQRGYNQAVLLAEAALAELREELAGVEAAAGHGVLRRMRDTESQFALTPKERRRNLRGAFAVREGAAMWWGARFCWSMTFIRRGLRRGSVRGCCGGLERAKVWVATAGAGAAGDGCDVEDVEELRLGSGWLLNACEVIWNRRAVRCNRGRCGSRG